jgi:3-deoxy-D-manno-octulosonic-acid transferase
LIGAVAGTPALAALVAARPRWREGMIERLGGAAAGGAPDSVDAIWVHGASVGEILAGLRLVDRLLARGLPVQTSTSTATARAMVRRMRPELPCRLSPLDHPWCVARALDRARPRALVLVETELWPCWIAAAARRSIPVIVVSGRLSDRSYPHYRRLARVFHGTVDRITGVGARTPLDAERFVELGVPASRVHVTGDLKLDGAKPPPLDPALVRVLEGPPLLVAGSTHPGEEEAALHALAAAERAGLAAALVLAPRHRERFDAVGELVRRSGRKLRRRSWLAAAGEPRLEAGEVLLLDSHGELGSVYAFARLAFVGGTLVARGGHNLLEPAEVGRPAAFGPSTQAVRAAAELLLGVGAAARVGDGAALGRAFVAALHDPGAADAQGDAGQRVLAAHRGSAERSAALVAELCAKAGP